MLRGYDTCVPSCCSEKLATHPASSRYGSKADISEKAWRSRLCAGMTFV